MKKLSIALIVIALFALYNFHQKSEADDISIAPQKQIFLSDTPSPFVSTAPISVLPSPTIASGVFKDGEYTGPTTNAFYGNIQVKAIIQNGRLVDVQFLQYPNDRRESIMINEQAMPYLKQEAIQAQSGQVDIVSGATDTSLAFIDSLNSALSQAK